MEVVPDKANAGSDRSAETLGEAMINCDGPAVELSYTCFLLVCNMLLLLLLFLVCRRLRNE